MFLILLFFLIAGSFFRVLFRNKKNVYESCGENKVIFGGRCVCNLLSGYYPMLGGFGVSHQVCYLCPSGEIKEINGQKYCDYNNIGTRKIKRNVVPNHDEQCSSGYILRDSKCEPLPVKINQVTSEPLTDVEKIEILMQPRIKKRLQSGKDLIESTYEDGKDLVESTFEDGKDLFDEGKDLAENTFDEGRDLVENTFDEGRDLIENTFDEGIPILSSIPSIFRYRRPKTPSPPPSTEPARARMDCNQPCNEEGDEDWDIDCDELEKLCADR